MVFCDQCGTKLEGGMSFCPGCGKPANAAPAQPLPSRGRVASHVRLVGIFWIALSAFRLVPGLAVFVIAKPVTAFLPWGLRGIVGTVLPLAGIVMLAAAAVGLAAGWGLLERQPWARILALVLAFLNLLDLPFGTALGVYTLWVLLPAESEREYLGER